MIALNRPVQADYLGAVQGIAALEQRITEMRSWPGDFTDEIAACHRLLAALRSTFGIRQMTEAEIDAAHEAAQAELDELIAQDFAIFLPDVPQAFGYVDRADEYRVRGA